MISKIITALSGKKTYLVALAIAVINLCVAFRWISPEHLDQINMVLVALGGAAIRAGISKVE